MNKFDMYDLDDLARPTDRSYDPILCGKAALTAAKKGYTRAGFIYEMKPGMRVYIPYLNALNLETEFYVTGEVIRLSDVRGLVWPFVIEEDGIQVTVNFPSNHPCYFEPDKVDAPLIIGTSDPELDRLLAEEEIDARAKADLGFFGDGLAH